MFAQLPPFALVLLAVAALLVLLVLLLLMRQRLRWRLLLALHARAHYRIRTLNHENVPSQGPALLVCNQLLHLDFLLLLLAHPRAIRCVLLESTAGEIARRAGAIIVAGAIDTAIQEAGDALARGEVVCLFTGRWRNDSGQDIGLTRLLPALQARCAVPIVPVHVDQRWGSLFQVKDGKIIRRSAIERPCQVWVSLGKPLPATTGPGEVRQAIARLGSDLALARKKTSLPVHRQFVRMASRHPLRPCIYDSATRMSLSYGKVLAAAMCLRRHLKPTLGANPMVAIWLPPGTAGALCNISLALQGKTSVNLNYTAGTDSIQSALRQCNIRHVLTARRFTERLPLNPGPGVEMIYLDDLLPAISQGEKLRAFLKVLLLPRFVLERWVLGLRHQRADDLATIIFSSGTTGEPKGIVLSHGNLTANLESMIQLIHLSRDDSLLGVLPFFHSFGYAVTLWGPLMAGASAVYHADPRQAKEIGDLCRGHRCTIFLNTPTFLRFCLRRCDPGDFRTLRVLVCGAEKLPPSLAEEFHTRFGVRPLEGYGCTELSPVAAANTPDEPLDGLMLHHNKIGSIGPPVPGVSARIVDPDTRQTLSLGQEGLLLVRGANVMEGYLHRPEMTAGVICENEYSTGDMGRIDDEGCITLTGRLSRFAKIGGEMVPLEKIEEELHGLLQTSERVLAVASVPDDKRGERLVVLHLPHLSSPPHHLCRGLSDRGLPNLWVPGERDFFPVPNLPTLGSGKLDLRGVKDMALSAVRGN